MLIFVYGSLRRNQSAASLMRSARFVGVGHIRAKLQPTPAGYTGLIPGEGTLPGELFEVEETIFPRLDAYEGADYIRRLSTVFNENGEECSAWVYWWTAT